MIDTRSPWSATLSVEALGAMILLGESYSGPYLGTTIPPLVVAVGNLPLNILDQSPLPTHPIHTSSQYPLSTYPF